MTYGFGDLDDYYPGSKERPSARQHAVVIAERRDPFEGIKPYLYEVRGVETEFFMIGQLAQALGRRAVTVRKWETEGIIPKATFTVNLNEHKDPRARRRLYSRPQAEGIVRIAGEEGLLGERPKPIKKTQFTERVTELFKELKARRA